MVTINNLSFAYKVNQPVLQNINLNLEEGHIYGILGRNGVGKSTLLKLINGALIGKGSVKVNGIEASQRSAALQEQMRLVPENEALYPITITELAAVTAPLYPTFSQQFFQKALAEFEVDATQKLTDMSLGQQKKALVSLALACGTPYLFMDEPTNGMDIPSKSIFRKLVAAMADEQKTIMISTHQVDDLNGLIDSIVILSNNGVLLSATLEELYEKYGTEDIKEIFCRVAE